MPAQSELHFSLREKIMNTRKQTNGREARLLLPSIRIIDTSRRRLFTSVETIKQKLCSAASSVYSIVVANNFRDAAYINSLNKFPRVKYSVYITLNKSTVRTL